MLNYDDIIPYTTVLVNGDTGWKVLVMAIYGSKHEEYPENTKYIISVKDIYHLPDSVRTIVELNSLNLSVYKAPTIKDFIKKPVKVEEQPFTMTQSHRPGDYH